MNKRNSNFFFESVEIDWIERKIKLWFFRFIFFELWLCLVIFVPHNSKNWYFIRFSTFRIISKNRIKTEGAGGICIFLVGKYPIYTSYSFEIERNIILATFFFLIISQTEFCLAYNQKEIIRKHHIPFNLKRNNKYILLSVCLYVTTTARPQATIHHVGNSTFSASQWVSDSMGVGVHMLGY